MCAFSFQLYIFKSYIMKRIYVALFSLISLSVVSQSVTHGPIVGGVSDTSCRVFVRTDASTSVTIELSTSPSFSTIDASATVTTDAGKDTIAIAAVTGLTADTKYYVRTTIGGTPSGIPAYFMTYPATGAAAHQVFVTGSCLYDLTNADSGLFVRAAMYLPKAFIQCGDWGYPDANSGAQDIYLSNPPTSFAVNMNNHRTFYKLRYQSPSSVGFMRTLCTDYVYDDHDYLNDNTAKDAASGFGLDFLGDLGAPKVYSQPVQARLNTIQAYQEWFPGYKLTDSTEGIYHSFRSGNVEVFVVDTRSMRTPQASAIKKIGGVWTYSPPAGYSILGANQTAWLQNGLLNSTATWKIIISSDAFNLGLRLTVDSLIKIGGGSVSYWAPEVQGITIPNYGYTAVQNYADCWAGFKEDADSLVKFVMNNNIKNVFVVSGDTHTVGLDDGTNSGLPELNSGNLKKANSQEWVTNQQFTGYNIWNKGGSGLCQENNFDNTFGKIEVYGDDSLRLSAVTESGSEVTGWTFMVNEPYKYNKQYHPNRLPVAVNDAASVALNDTVTVSVLNNDTDMENDPLYVTLQTSPANGTASVNGNNTITYIPNTNFSGVDTFRYLVCDHSNMSCLNCATALVTVNAGGTSVITLASDNVRVYPNPAKDVVFIKSDLLQRIEVQLLNLLGETLIQQTITGSGNLNTSALPSGNYLLRLTLAGTQETADVKLQITR